MSDDLDYEKEFKSLTQYLLNHPSPFIRDSYRDWKCNHCIWEAINLLKEKDIISSDYIFGVSELIIDNHQKREDHDAPRP